MKNVLATIAGIISSVGLVFVLEATLMFFFPLPKSQEVDMALIPDYKIFVIGLIYAISVFVGVLVANSIAKKSLIPAYIVSALFLFSVGVNWVETSPKMYLGIIHALLTISGIILAFMLSKKKPYA